MLDKKPVVALALAAHAHQHPAAFQLVAGKQELQLALAQRGFRIGAVFSRPETPVPQHDGAAAILALWDGAFKVSVFERMILDLDRQSLVMGVKRRPLRHGPRFENAVDFEAEIIMKASRCVLLDDEAGVIGRSNLRPAAWLVRLREIPFLLVEG